MFEVALVLVCVIALSWGWHQRQIILRQVESDARHPRKR